MCSVDFLRFKYKVRKALRMNLEELFNTPVVSGSCIIFLSHTFHRVP